MRVSSRWISLVALCCVAMLAACGGDGPQADLDAAKAALDGAKAAGADAEQEQRAA